EIDVEPVRVVDLAGLDHRRHERAERRRAEDDDGELLQRLRVGGGADSGERNCQQQALYRVHVFLPRGPPSPSFRGCPQARTLHPYPRKMDSEQPRRGFRNDEHGSVCVHLILNSLCASPPLIEAAWSGFSPAAATIFSGSSSPIGNGMSEPSMTRS